MQEIKIRVLIVEDSRLYQMYLRKVLEREPFFEVAGIAGSGEEAKKMVEQLHPDVITLDLNLPDVSGFELLRYLLSHTKIPIIVVSSLPQACEEALRLGAKDFMEKVSEGLTLSTDQFAILLQMKIKMQARGVRRRKEIPGIPGKRPILKKNQSVIAIGASLGGTESTLEILRELPEDMPGIVIVQHMPMGFTRPYALRLNQNCRLSVAEAKDGERILPGKVLVAESGKHLTVVRTPEGYRVRSRAGERAGGFCPSVDVLFSSVAEACEEGIGVILTGMGRDGVQGIGRMHEKGFYTVGQDKESCAVFGMPQAASQAKAIDELLSPQQIAARLIAQCKNR